MTVYVGLDRIIRFTHIIYVYEEAFTWKWRADGNTGPVPRPARRDPTTWSQDELDHDKAVIEIAQERADELRRRVALHLAAQQAAAKPPPEPSRDPQPWFAGPPPSRPDPNEPWMRDGSHLLASEAGRRKIDPVTGKRMIREMVLTENKWPHWKWVEDVEGENGVGPWGPGTTVWSQHDPRNPTSRESIRPSLEKEGRLEDLQYYSDEKY